MGQTELLTADQLADRLRIRPRTVRQWARRGQIPVLRLTKKVVRFDWAAVVAVLRGHVQGCDHAK